jgi:hypothetical protein
MKTYIAHTIFVLINLMTLGYAASTAQINVLYILLACIAILLNYHCLIPNNKQ